MEQQKEDNRYFVPDVEDLRMGYVYWYNVEQEQYPDNWGEWVIEDLEDYIIAKGQLEKGILRAMYLTQQQIEELGWGVDCELTDISTRYTKGNWLLCYNKETHRVLITTIDELPGYLVKSISNCLPTYRGECKDKNTLRYIMKLLKIQ